MIKYKILLNKKKLPIIFLLDDGGKTTHDLVTIYKSNICKQYMFRSKLSECQSKKSYNRLQNMMKTKNDQDRTKVGRGQ